VVAHQDDLGAAADAALHHDAHAVVRAGRDEAVGHHVAAPAVAFVAEAGGQLDQRQAGRQVVDRRGRAIGAVQQRRGAGRCTGRSLGDAAGQRGDGAGERGGDGSGAALEQAATARVCVIHVCSNDRGGV
jgi:hypothetical protein